MRTKFLLLLFILQIKPLFAQQDALLSMYMFDKMLVNPAFTGSSSWAVGTLKYRDQFVGFKGHPVTKTFTFHSPVQRKHIGLGLKVISDKIAIVNNLHLAGLFSYHLNFAGGKLSVGLEAGVINKRINYQELVVGKQGDNALPVISASASVPDVAYGLYYQKKQFYAGFSHYHLIKQTFNYNTPLSGAQLYNHYYLLFGNVYKLSKKWFLEPSALLKLQPAFGLQIDLNTMVHYQDVLGIGLQYRNNGNLVSLLKINVSENLRIAYSYDYAFGQFASYLGNAHEVVVSYGLKLPPPPSKKEIHPRYYF